MMPRPVVFSKDPVLKEFFVNFPVVHVFGWKGRFQNHKQALQKILKVCDIP
jgi:hypothetical protein